MEPHLAVGEDCPTRILVVEDEPTTSFLIAEALREEGVTVIEASDTDEASSTSSDLSFG